MIDNVLGRLGLATSRLAADDKRLIASVAQHRLVRIVREEVDVRIMIGSGAPQVLSLDLLLLLVLLLLLLLLRD